MYPNKGFFNRNSKKYRDMKYKICLELNYKDKQNENNKFSKKNKNISTVKNIVLWFHKKYFLNSHYAFCLHNSLSTHNLVYKLSVSIMLMHNGNRKCKTYHLMETWLHYCRNNFCSFVPKNSQEFPKYYFCNNFLFSSRFAFLFHLSYVGLVFLSPLNHNI